MTIGIFETGSIKRPRMVISTSMRTPSTAGCALLGCLRFLYHQFAEERVGKAGGGSHWDVVSNFYFGSGGLGGGEIQGFVLGCAAHPLGAGFVAAFNHY